MRKHDADDTGREPRNGAETKKEVEGEKPARRDDWRPPASMNPWARAFDADQLPDEPYMGSNKKPKPRMLPYPDPAAIPPTPERAAAPDMHL